MEESDGVIDEEPEVIDQGRQLCVGGWVNRLFSHQVGQRKHRDHPFHSILHPSIKTGSHLSE